MIVLDNPPQAANFRKGTYVLHIQNTPAHFSHRTISSHIFEVNEGNTVCMCLKIRNRIDTCVGSPVHI